MRKKHHIFFIANISLLLIAIILGLVFQGSISDCGISHLSNIKDVEDSHIVLNYAWNENDEGGLTLTSFGSDVDLYGVAFAEIIAGMMSNELVGSHKFGVGQSITANIIQTEGSIGQEFTVKEIIKGDASLSVGNTAYVYQYFGFQEVDGHIEFMNTLNLMNPENDYLIFMDSSPLNAYQNEPAFILKSEFFGYIKTDHTDTLTLEGNYRDYNFSDLANYEFFSTSESVTKTLNYIRSELLKKFT